MCHERFRLGRQLAFGLDPILEGVARPPHSGHPQTHPYLVIEGDLATVGDLDPSHHERDLGSSAETLPPELGAGSGCSIEGAEAPSCLCFATEAAGEICGLGN
jgi:hypothetical protein